jgi:hypothetical protein
MTSLRAYTSLYQEHQTVMVLMQPVLQQMLLECLLLQQQ